MIRRWAVLLLSLAACQSLPYKDDVGYLVSAQANSPEFPVKINGAWCVDMDGSPGLCAKRVKSTESVRFGVDPMPYAYLMTVSCTSGVRPVEPANVPAGQRLDLELPASAFSEFRAFTYIGEFSPQDRTPPISARFKVSVAVYDAEYVPRERILRIQEGGKNYLVLGQFARSAWVFDQGAWSAHSFEPIVEIKGDPAQVKAISEKLRYALQLSRDRSMTADPRFKYRDIRPPAIPVELLDSLAASIFDPNAAKLGWVGLIVTGVKLTLAVAYLTARDRLIAASREFEKQEYERAQAGGNQGDVDHDDLGGEHK